MDSFGLLGVGRSRVFRIIGIAKCTITTWLVLGKPLLQSSIFHLLAETCYGNTFKLIEMLVKGTNCAIN